MLQNILAKIIPDDGMLQNFLSFFSLYDTDDFMYYSVLKNKFDFNDDIIFKIIKVLINYKYIEIIYIVKCPNCGEIVGKYSDISDAYNSLICYDCGCPFNLKNGIFVAYKVVKKYD